MLCLGLWRKGAVDQRWQTRDGQQEGNVKKRINSANLRDLSCLLRCSLRLKARLQNWHLYFFSGWATVGFRTLDMAEPAASTLATGMMNGYRSMLSFQNDVKIVCSRAWA